MSPIETGINMYANQNAVSKFDGSRPEGWWETLHRNRGGIAKKSTGDDQSENASQISSSGVAFGRGADCLEKDQEAGNGTGAAGQPGCGDAGGVLRCSNTVPSREQQTQARLRRRQGIAVRSKRPDQGGAVLGKVDSVVC